MKKTKPSNKNNPLIVLWVRWTRTIVILIKKVDKFDFRPSSLWFSDNGDKRISYQENGLTFFSYFFLLLFIIIFYFYFFYKTILSIALDNIILQVTTPKDPKNTFILDVYYDNEKI